VQFLLCVVSFNPLSLLFLFIPMSTSSDISGFSGNKLTKSSEKPTFSQTCNLLSQYLKEKKGSFEGLNLHKPCTPETNGKLIYFEFSSYSFGLDYSQKLVKQSIISFHFRYFPLFFSIRLQLGYLSFLFLFLFNLQGHHLVHLLTLE